MSATPSGAACAVPGSAGIIGQEGPGGRGADGRTGAASEPTQGRRAACRRGRRVRRDGLAGVRWGPFAGRRRWHVPVSYTHLRAHETRHDLVCRLLLEKKKKNT